MIGSFLPSISLNWDPTDKWFFEDNGVTGICAMRGYPQALPSMILPRRLPEDQQKLMAWAFEEGLARGKQIGRQDLQQELRMRLGLVDGSLA